MKEIINKTVTIIEHRAPTDKSVREMELAARKKMIDSVTVSDNDFSYHYQVEYDFKLGGRKVAIKVLLNGKTYLLFADIADEAEFTSKERAQNKIAELLCRQIIVQLLAKVFKR